jgi:hypothetical protein
MMTSSNSPRSPAETKAFTVPAVSSALPRSTNMRRDTMRFGVLRNRSGRPSPAVSGSSTTARLAVAPLATSLLRTEATTSLERDMVRTQRTSHTSIQPRE